MQKTGIILTASLFGIVSGYAQKVIIKQERNVITTMVPFLTITPDSRSGALGDAGTAIINPDANSVYWNAANLVNSQTKSGFGMSVVPWMRGIVKDMGLSYLSGFKKFGDRTAAGFSMKYFSLGKIDFTDIDGNPLGSFEPNEFALDGCVGIKLNKKFSVGTNLRFIYSNLTGTRLTNGVSTKPGFSGGGDVNMLYKTSLKIKGKNTPFQLGANIQNMGAKMTYTNRESRDFLPTSLKLGAGWSYEMDDYNKVNLLLDVNKLLVPSLPVRDSIGNVISGKDNNVGVVQGMLQSFYDAPGGFSEEFKELNYAFGAEYWYNNSFAARTGLFYEALSKGNRQYVTMGIGIKYKKTNLDLSFLMPVTKYKSPLANTLRISLIFDFNKTEN